MPSHLSTCQKASTTTFNRVGRLRNCLAILLTSLSLGGLSQVAAQDSPQIGPKLLTIIREHVKVGRAAEHNKLEREYPAAFEKADSPDYYLAMTSMTGPSEAWYLIGNSSHAAIEEAMKREDKDPVLSAELNRLALADAQYISGVELIRGFARPELNVGDFPDLTQVRYVEVSIFRIRPGREDLFEGAARAYASALKRVAPKASYRVYSVLAGMDQPTYIVLSSAEKYDEFDARLTAGEALLKEATDDEKKALMKFADAAERVETQHFRIDPMQSYVPKEWRDQDSEFWSHK
jgi:hypothetical protein